MNFQDKQWNSKGLPWGQKQITGLYLRNYRGSCFQGSVCLLKISLLCCEKAVTSSKNQKGSFLLVPRILPVVECWICMTVARFCLHSWYNHNWLSAGNASLAVGWAETTTTISIDAMCCLAIFQCTIRCKLTRRWSKSTTSWSILHASFSSKEAAAPYLPYHVIPIVKPSIWKSAYTSS